VAATQVFISYSSEDEELRQELERHLSLLKREGLIETWTFRAIEAGTHWRAEIDEHLETAEMILLLVSASFVDSDYCWNVEMKRALQRHREGTARVIPIIARECDWTSAPFAGIQALPPGAKAVTSWRPHDKAWTEIAKALRAVLAKPVGPGQAENMPPAPETAVQRAHRLVADARARQAHDEKLGTQGAAAFRAEAQAVFSSLESQAAEIRVSAGVSLKTGCDSLGCTVRLDPLRHELCPITLYVSPRRSLAARPGAHLVAIWYLGGMALPQERNVGYFAKPKHHAEKNYSFQLTTDGRWVWRDPKTNSDLSSSDLAGVLLQDVLQIHDDLETGKVALPDPDDD
jgi:hypothetical protein